MTVDETRADRMLVVQLDAELRAAAEALAVKQGQELQELVVEAIRLAVARGSSR